MKAGIIFMLLLVGISTTLSGQHITGSVLDSISGRPVSGATVRWNGSSVSVGSGDAGQYQIRFAEADTLLISAMGYGTKKIYAAAPGTINVLLSSADNQIETVEINTGYYRISRERASGSFAHVGNEELNRNPSPNLLQRLEGLVPGLQFVNTNGTSKDDIRIRGLSTIESDESPLIVLDNFPYEGDINNLDPDDIESVTVLRDAAAASIWGARAGNGVIVITTKTGKRDGKIRVALRHVRLTGEKPDLSYGSSFLPSDVLMDIEKKRYEEGEYVFEDNLAVPLYVDLLKMVDEERITVGQLGEHEDRFRGTDIRKQAEKYLYRGEGNSQYNLNLSGGGNKYGFQASLGYMKADRQVIGDNNQRMNVSFRNDFKPMDFLQLSLGLAYVEQKADNNGVDLLTLQRGVNFPVSPYYDLMDGNGPTSIVKDVRHSYAQDVEQHGLLDWLYRPLADRKLADNSSWSNEVRLNTEINADLWKGLSLRGNYQLTKGMRGSSSHHLKDSYYVRDLVNRFTQANGTRIIPHNGILQIGNPGEMVSHYGRAQLQYDRQWVSDHHISALAGMEVRHAQSEMFPSSVLYNYHDEYQTGSNQYNFDQLYPTMPGGRSTRRIPSGSSIHSLITNRDLAYFGNIGYTYLNRYVLNGSIRWDGSNLFGVKANQKGVPLWSTGISWEINKEPFYSFHNIIPYLRIRTTYGIAGNVNRSVTHQPTIQYTGNSFVGLTTATLLSVGNPSLRWEKVGTYNVGLDFATRGNLLRGSIEYYTKAGSDLIGDDYMDPTSGITGNYKINYADIQSTGLDLSLTFEKRWGVWSWNSRLNGSIVENTIKNYRTQDNLALFNYFNAVAPPEKGRSKDAVYAIPWNGLDGQTGLPVIYIDGEKSEEYNRYYQQYLTKDDLVNVGASVPVVYGTWRNSLRIGGWEASAMLSWKSGYVFRRQSMGSMDEYSNLYHRDYLKRWTKPGDEAHTNVPVGIATSEAALYGGSSAVYKNGESLVERGDQLRIKDLTFGYNYRGGMLRKLMIENVSINLHVNNVGLLWARNGAGIDPDYIDVWYTAPRTYALALNINF